MHVLLSKFWLHLLLLEHFKCVLLHVSSCSSKTFLTTDPEAFSVDVFQFWSLPSDISNCSVVFNSHFFFLEMYLFFISMFFLLSGFPITIHVPDPEVTHGCTLTAATQVWLSTFQLLIPIPRISKLWVASNSDAWSRKCRVVQVIMLLLPSYAPYCSECFPCICLFSCSWGRSFSIRPCTSSVMSERQLLIFNTD